MDVPNIGHVDLETLIGLYTSFRAEYSQDTRDRDTSSPNWMLFDMLEPAQRFPYFPQQGGADQNQRARELVKARASALMLERLYNVNVVGAFALGTAMSACMFFEFIGISTKDHRVRAKRKQFTAHELVVNIELPPEYSFLNMMRMGVALAHLAKLEWFRTGHHTSLDQQDGLVQRASWSLGAGDPEQILKLVWHYSHLLDTRIACAHMGVLESFPGCPSYTTESDAYLKEIGAHIFPAGSGILQAADKIFYDLSRSNLAKYYKDTQGTLSRVRKAYQQVREDRAAYHPSAEQLGKTRKYYDLTRGDIERVGAIAHVIYGATVMDLWKDVLPPLGDVARQPVYQSLSYAKKKLNKGKDYELIAVDIPFSYSPFVNYKGDDI